ncbi:MAG: hypothetical protein E7585_07510 [Ruminococcaceae bacterium]|nr:hypothetical protein [Oscillospiraceae bacterium]
MTTKEAIDLACVLRPNELGSEALGSLLAELESSLATEVRGECPHGDCCPLVVTETVLSAPPPFDRLYWAYLVAMIDLSAKDLDAYGLSYALYQEARTAYARWYHRTRGKRI